MSRISGINGNRDLLVSLGDAIRAYRHDRALSQEALADASGVDRSHMGKIERGERNVTILNIERIAGALECRPSDLLIKAGY